MQRSFLMIKASLTCVPVPAPQLPAAALLGKCPHPALISLMAPGHAGELRPSHLPSGLGDAQGAQAAVAVWESGVWQRPAST